MRTKILSSVPALVAAFTIVACSDSNSLSRDKAAALVIESPEITAWGKSVHLNENAKDTAVRLDIVNSKGELSSFGEDILVGSSWRRLAWKSPPEASVEITGLGPVSNESARQTVEFIVRQQGLVPVGQAISVAGGTGTAIASRWDTGWRVANVRLETLSEPFPLSESTIAAIDDRREEVIQLRKERIERAVAEYAKCTEESTVTALDTSDVLAVEFGGIRGVREKYREFLVKAEFGANGMRVTSTSRNGGSENQLFRGFGEKYTYTREKIRQQRYERTKYPDSVALMLFGKPHLKFFMRNSDSAEKLLQEFRSRELAWDSKCIPVTDELNAVRREKAAWGDLSGYDPS